MTTLASRLIVHTLTFGAATALIVAILALAMNWDAILLYDAAHDILPDHLWNEGIPGNRYAQ